MNSETIKIIGISGSLRKNSYNKYLIMNMFEMLPENAESEILDLNGSSNL